MAGAVGELVMATGVSDDEADVTAEDEQATAINGATAIGISSRNRDLAMRASNLQKSKAMSSPLFWISTTG